MACQEGLALSVAWRFPLTENPQHPTALTDRHTACSTSESTPISAPGVPNEHLSSLMLYDKGVVKFFGAKMHIFGVSHHLSHAVSYPPNMRQRETLSNDQPGQALDWYAYL